MALNLPSEAFAEGRADWMSTIGPAVKVSQLTIPGTRDAARFNTRAKTANLAERQGWDIKEQLNNAIRAFDLRYDHEKGDLGLYRGDTWPFICTCYDRAEIASKMLV